MHDLNMQHVARVMLVAIVAAGFANSVARAAEPSEPDKASMRITFLSKQAGGRAIVAEKIEPYFKLMTALDMNGKLTEPIKGDSADAIRDAVKKQYQQAILSFSDEEKHAITACLRALEPTFKKHYPLLVKVDWRLIKKSNSLESAAHFTREDCIVLSESYTRHALRWYKRLVKGEVKQTIFVTQLARLLLHEQMHVLQRLYPKRFAELYTQHWAYIRATKIDDHPWLAERRAVNPDGVDLGWVHAVEEDDATAPRGESHPHYIWPQVLYKTTEGHPRLFRHTVMVGVFVHPSDEGFKVVTDKDGLPVYKPLKDLPQFTKKFHFGGAYHPNEAAAGALPRVILEQYAPLKPSADRAKILKPFVQWAGKYLQ